MQEEHPSNETLSAYLDAAVDASERRAVDSHLGGCDRCRDTLADLAGASQALSGLPAVEVDAELHRLVRQAVLKKAPPRRARMFRLAAASSAAVVILAGGGFLLSQRPAPPPQVAENLAADGPSDRDFDSDAEIRDAVSDDPSITQGLRLYRVRDVGAAQERLLQTEAKQSFTAKSNSDADQTAGGSSQALTDAPYTTAVDECLRRVIRSQPYPMMPLLLTDATYKKTPAWMFAFAWTTSTDDDAPLDRLQVWLVARTDCSTLSFAQLNP